MCTAWLLTLVAVRREHHHSSDTTTSKEGDFTCWLWVFSIYATGYSAFEGRSMRSHIGRDFHILDRLRTPRAAPVSLSLRYKWPDPLHGPATAAIPPLIPV